MRDKNMPFIVAVDFDGTLCTDAFPNIGEANGTLISTLRALQNAFGNLKLVLWTCRNGKALEEAVAFCDSHELRFDAVNENLQEVKEKYGGDTRKVMADMYLDDKAFPIALWEDSLLRLLTDTLL